MNVHKRHAFRPQSRPLAAGADLMLTSGGDERILIDPVTRRTRYGTSVAPCPGEIFLSSSTASSTAPGAYRAVEAAWAALISGRLRIEPWFESLRSRLLDLLGVPGGEVVLTGSGTETEFVALAVAQSVLGGPLTNLVVAPAETGSGVLRAAGGAHFLGSTPFGGMCERGKQLSGWASVDIAAAIVEMRDANGDLRAPDAVDAQARGLAAEAIGAGRKLLLHRLETSKTGQSALGTEAILQIMASAPDRAAALVDCCQLRCSRERVHELLELGFMVAITGSKFFGGPPFSGALLLPPSIVARLARLELPLGLADYSARLDWPENLRTKTSLRCANEANLGLGLRWVAALHEMERFFSAPDKLRSSLLAHFTCEVRKRGQSEGNICELSENANGVTQPNGILPYVMEHPDGSWFSAAETATIHARLREPLTFSSARAASHGRIFHLGQPVAVGQKTALRVCASAPMISDLAERVIAGESLRAAFLLWERDLDALFDKWKRLMAEVSDRR